MSGGEDINTTETKLDLILKAIESLSMRTNILENFEVLRGCGLPSSKLVLFFLDKHYFQDYEQFTAFFGINFGLGNCGLPISKLVLSIK